MKMHLSLRVTDLSRSLAFYEAFFGVPPHKVRPGYANFDLAEPPLKFALNESPMETGKGPLDHLGFQVESTAEVERAKERLKAAGLATFDETDTTCCYAKQDKIWVHDPDGNEWEVYVITDDLPDHQQDTDHAGKPISADAAAEKRTFRTLRIAAGGVSALPLAAEPGGSSCCGETESGCCGS